MFLSHFTTIRIIQPLSLRFNRVLQEIRRKGYGGRNYDRNPDRVKHLNAIFFFFSFTILNLIFIPPPGIPRPE